jgi:hypothetical protein
MKLWGVFSIAIEISVTNATDSWDLSDFKFRVKVALFRGFDLKAFKQSTITYLLMVRGDHFVCSCGFTLFVFS